MPPKRKATAEKVKTDKAAEEDAISLEQSRAEQEAREAEKAVAAEKVRALQAEHITQDAKRLCTVDIATPFRNLQDALDRLLPFHVRKHQWGGAFMCISLLV